MQSKGNKDGALTVGYFWNFGATALPLVGAFITSLIIARWMGPRIVGLINLTMALATVFLIVGKFGVDGAASRLASEYHAVAPWLIPPLVRSGILLRLLFTVPAAVAASAFAPQLSRFFNDEALLPLFRISGLLIFAVSLNEFSALLVIGIERFRLLFLMRGMMLLLRVGLVFLAAVLAYGAAGALGGYAIGAFVPGLFILIALLRIKSGVAPPVGAEGVWGRLFRLSAPLAVSGASVTVYSLLDKLMLGYYQGASELGLYSMARNMVETSLFPTFALIMTLRPALAGAYSSGDMRRCSDILNRSVRNSLVFAFCVIVVFSCLARPLVVGLYKEDFSPAAILLLLFLPLVLMRSLGSIILPSLIAAEKAGTYARLTLTGAVLNFLLNMLLIPVWKAEGAIAATLLSYLPVEILGLRTVFLSFPRCWRRGDTSRILKMAAAAACIVAAYLRFVPAPGGLPGAISHALAVAAVFLGGMFVLRVLSAEEITSLLRALGFSGREDEGGK